MVQRGQTCSYPVMSTDDPMRMQRTTYGHLRQYPHIVVILDLPLDPFYHLLDCVHTTPMGQGDYDCTLPKEIQ